MRQPNQVRALKTMSETVSARGSLNECYFANKGAALVLAGCERRRVPAFAPLPPQPQPQSDIQHHLQAMFYLLRPEETLKMAVKLESAHAGRTRYLVVVCHGDEAALLGIDCNEHTTVGLALRVLADTSIKLDGDGGFSVCVCNRQHIFKPVSVQAMWSALQTLHRASGRARALNHFAGGASHAWCAYYEERVDSDRSCLNEWHAMDSIESRRPPSPDSLRLKPRERDETERVIRCTLKEIMMSVDLDEVTSKAIRGRLEDELDMDLAEYKSFIDQEMLTILGQMDAPTEIFEHVYLGSEWNASNLEELQRNGVRHILNVTREIDNFFPGVFDYLNIRVYDDEKTDLLKHWDNTFKYINKARNEGSKVLVHCKMGISRSASVVIAYAMKAYNWNFDKALKHVKAKRNCIKPNTNFLNQLETYQGILDAMKNKEKLQRSKSETNLKSPKISKSENKVSDPTPLVLALTGSCARRPRSWSPDTRLAAELLPPTSLSLESLAFETRHMLMPYGDGTYSVSPNQIIRLKEEGAPSVKHIVNEIENAASGDRRDSNKRYQRLNFGTSDTSSNRSSDASVGSILPAEPVKPPQVSPLRNLSHKYPHTNCDPDKIHTWDPGEPWRGDEAKQDNLVKSDSGIIDLKTKVSDVLSNLVDRNSDGDERRGADEEGALPSRQSSWSSFDSAVVPDLSRHSSWGSHEPRRAEPPPQPPPPPKPACDLGIISEHSPGAAAPDRPPPRLSDNERKFNETCAILTELATAAARMERARDRGASTWSGRLSASAPADTWLRAGLRRRRPVAASVGDLPRAAAPPPPAPAPASAAQGLVSNLKKEFEARSETDSLRRSKSRSRASTVDGRERVPTSPPAGEDISVKVLVDRYDQPSRLRCESVSEPSRSKPADSVPKKCKLTAEAEARGGRGAAALRNSFCGAVRGVAGAGAERPPIAPTVVSIAPLDYSNVVVSTVMSKAQNKKQLQHGKTHPLTRLNLNRSNNRCSNPVYNTM
ncbi:protein phosphatase Slingshot isoform X2 [Choristoneura fumiferana]|uniref:protein phosphatase Slingshot isoform X2 n=1 Tax=Choristoneura fumiferana TaxID=7141 RepID=UPI003D158D9D